MKSGVEYLAQHPGWKTSTKKVSIDLDELSKILLHIDEAVESDCEQQWLDTLNMTRDTLAELVDDPDRRIDE